MSNKVDAKYVGTSKFRESGGVSGYVYVADANTPIPTSYDSELGSAFKGLGYITDDGLTEPAALSLGDNFNDNNGNVIGQADPEYAKTWTGAFAQAIDPDVLTALFGKDNVSINSTTGVMTVKEKNIVPEHHVIVVDELIKGKAARHIMADATIVLTDDITHTSSDLVTYGFTITAFPTADYPDQITYYQIDKAPTGQSVDEPAAPSMEPAPEPSDETTQMNVVPQSPEVPTLA